MNKGVHSGRALAKRITALLTALLMVLGIMPLGEVAYAEVTPTPEFTVTSVEYTTVVDETGKLTREIAINGTSLDGATIDIKSVDGPSMTKIPYSPLIGVTLDSVKSITIKKEIKGINETYTQEKTIEIQPVDKTVIMPSITSIDNSVVYSGSAEPEGKLIINGSNLGGISKVGDIPDDAYNEYFMILRNSNEKEQPLQGVRYTPDEKDENYKNYDKSKNIIINNLTGALGSADIIFGYKHKSGDTTITIKSRYEKKFRLVDNLNLSEADIKMTPTKGPASTKDIRSKIEFTSSKPLDYEVFLVKEKKEFLTDSNRCLGRVYNGEGSEKFLTVEVPANKPAGDYYVVFAKRNSYGEITGQQILGEDKKFTIVALENQVNIVSVSRTSGPTQVETPVTISGTNIWEIPDFGGLKPEKIEDGYNVEIKNKDGYVDEQLKIGDYKAGDAVAVYPTEGLKDNNGKTITSLKRVVSVAIGDQVPINEYSVNPDGLENVTVKTRKMTNETNDPKDYEKAIKITVKTIVTTESNPHEVTVETNTYRYPFKYVSSFVSPEVTEVTPDEVFVEKKDGQEKIWEIKEKTQISIEGRNFLIQKYYDNTTKQNEVSFPTIKFLNGIEIKDKNLITVLKGDKVLTGGEGELGNRILVEIPAKQVVTNLGEFNVIVTNPMKDSNKSGESSMDNINASVKFQEISEKDEPVIKSVEPDAIPVEGGDIKIAGSNFKNPQIVIDGIKLDASKYTVKTEGNTSTINLKAPKCRPGVTQIQVINPGGGMAISEIRYVSAGSGKPKIIEMQPKIGTKDTPVILKGENFVKPNSTTYGVDKDIYKLIGTRVMLGGKDVNEYELDEKGKIILKEFMANEQLLSFSSPLKAADYHRSIVLRKGDDYFIMYVSPKGQITLSSNQEKYTFNLGKDGEGKTIIEATDGNGEKFIVKMPYVKINGNNYYEKLLLKDKNDSSREFNFTTPYKSDKGQITGNRANVNVNGDINEIHITMPEKGISGLYDVKVINPDTNEYTFKDKFEYRTGTITSPKITSIEPPLGSVDGGYTITINGETVAGKECFVPGGIQVLINGVPATDVRVLANDVLTAKVPPLEAKYVQMLQGMDIPSLKVRVTVINGDGQFATKLDEFEYIKPSTKPHIDKLVLGRNPDTGEEYVDIEGDQFMKSWTSPENKTFNYEVYFGETKVTYENKDFISSKRIRVALPPMKGNANKVDVYVVNADKGISNKLPFTYTISKPTIKSVTPNVGNKVGGEEIHISGSGFKTGKVNVYRNGFTLNQMMLVRFGEISNRSIDKDQPNAGRMDSVKPVVKFESGLTVEYNGASKSLNVSLKVNGVEYSKNSISYDYLRMDNNVVFIPLKVLKNGNSNLDTNELVRLEVADGRLLVERGYVDGADLLGTTDISVKTIPYPTIGKVGVFVINPDGGAAKGDFEYKSPSSKPAIVNIQKDSKDPEAISGERIIKATYKGGSAIKIIGQDFRENATIKIGNLAELGVGQIKYSLPGELSFKMPAVPESEVGKKIEVFVENADGGIASSKKSAPPIYIIFTKGESAPQIESITPAKGPSRGGEEAVIKGTDFRAGLSVIFGGKTVEPANITLIDYKTIKVKTPAHPSGTVDVSVENPDGERATLSGGYTYISSPAISKLYDADGKAEIKSISINGGQKITVKGSDFQSGARVVFMVEIEAAFGEGDIYIGSKTYKIKSSVEAAGVEFIDENTLRVTTPEGKLKGSGIMVINPDKGASDIFAGANYGLEKPAPPEGVTAELIYDDKAIRITWKAVEGAREYEIYESEDGSAYELAFSTKGTSYVYQGVEPRTSYRFKVKAMGNIATSDSSKESKEVTTGSKAGYQDTDGKLSENTSASMSGDRASVTIGTSSYKNGMTIDLTSGSLAGAKTVTISMPSAVVKASSAGEIRVIGRDFAVQFSPYAFRDALGGADELSGIKLTISPAYSSSEPGNTALSGEYKIEATAYEKGTERAIYTAGSPIYITLDFDRQKIQMRRLSNIFISWRDPSSSIWEKQGEITATYDSAVAARVYKLGSYRVTGSK